MGFLLAERQIPILEIYLEPWFPGALVLGALFIAIFFVMAMTAQKNGVSVTSIAGKMSVVVPILFGIFLYNESVTFFKILGIVIALIAVYLSSVKEEKQEKNGTLLFPVLLFIGSGTIDTLLKYVQVNYVADADVSVFSGSLFGIAAIFGFVILTIRTIKKREAFGLKNVLAGIILGVPNYYSIVFLMKALQNKNIENDNKFALGGKWLRGFDSLGAGPRNSSTTYIGGNNLFVTKFDLSRPLLSRHSDNPIDLNLFTDVGTIFGNNENPTYSKESIRASYGVGVKFYTPIGPIGLSWSFPIQSETYDIKRSFLFSIGDLS